MNRGNTLVKILHFNWVNSPLDSPDSNSSVRLGIAYYISKYVHSRPWSVLRYPKEKWDKHLRVEAINQFIFLPHIPPVSVPRSIRGTDSCLTSWLWNHSWLILAMFPLYLLVHRCSLSNPGQCWSIFWLIQWDSHWISLCAYVHSRFLVNPAEIPSLSFQVPAGLPGERAWIQGFIWKFP